MRFFRAAAASPEFGSVIAMSAAGRMLSWKPTFAVPTSKVADATLSPDCCLESK
jgi:hypothetical protein